jgi:hypothetical protein
MFLGTLDFHHRLLGVVVLRSKCNAVEGIVGKKDVQLDSAWRENDED